MTAVPTYAADPEARFENYAEFYRKSAYARFDQEHREGGSLSLKMFRAQQNAIDLIDAAVPDYVFFWDLHGPCSGAIDLGDGRLDFKRIAPNLMHIVPPMTEAHFRIDEPNEFFCASIPARKIDLLLESYELDGSSFGHHYPVRGNPLDPEPAAPSVALMRKLWHALATPKASSLIIDGLVMQLVGTAAGTRDTPNIATDDTRIVRAIEYIEAHYGDSLSVVELAAIAALSPSQFAALFRQAVGEPVWTYVQRRRCERACEKVMTTSTPLAAIAEDCGFHDHSHMTRGFKRQFGVTPSEMRNGR
ncbi:AraC family transcriptional regulator [Roseobacter weihaiensis]|uniref:AraC family transcriptional regulator n=1 Tax=Roseobacter weihaiensis TaxID=2763262 RepID=UPI001D0B78B1|nr:AraC family transcriptional regulator [Roseobacter sp. H9]